MGGRVPVSSLSGGSRGVAADIEIQAREILLMRQRLNELIAEHTGQPVERIEEDTDRDYWMNPEEALEYGIIDSVQYPQRSGAQKLGAVG